MEGRPRGGSRVLVVTALVVAAMGAAIPARATSASSSFRLTYTGRVTGLASPGLDLVVNGDGVYDAALRQGRISVSDSSGGAYTVVLDGDTIYESAPALGGGWRTAPSWTAQSLPAALYAVRMTDPTAAAAGVLRAAGDIVDLGSHQQLTVDPARMGAPGLAPFPAEVWIDDEGRLRRLDVTVVFGRGLVMTYSVELSDFGVPVDVEVPTAIEDGAPLSHVMPAIGASALGSSVVPVDEGVTLGEATRAFRDTLPEAAELTLDGLEVVVYHDAGTAVALTIHRGHLVRVVSIGPGADLDHTISLLRDLAATT